MPPPCQYDIIHGLEWHRTPTTLPGWSSLPGAPLNTSSHHTQGTHTHTFAETPVTCITHPTAPLSVQTVALLEKCFPVCIVVCHLLEPRLWLMYFQTQLHSAIMPHTFPFTMLISYCPTHALYLVNLANVPRMIMVFIVPLNCTNTNCKA